jgi:hypothetical protein
MKGDKMVGTYRGRCEMRTKLLLGRLKRRDHSEDIDVDGRKILKWFFRKWN